MRSATGQSIFAAACVLAAVGLVAVATANAGRAGITSADQSFRFFLKRNIVAATLAFAVFLVLVDLDYRNYARLAPLVYFVTLVLLALVLVPGIGVKVNGQRRWFRFAGFSFQPSEVAKIAVVLSIARFASLKGASLASFGRGLLPGLALVGAPCVLIGLETDFGTALFVGAIGVVLLLVAGARLTHLVPLVASGLPVVLYFGVTRFHHVRERVKIFLHPEIDPLGKGHQIRQSLIALGNGDVAGLGLGLGRQKRFFLPEESTDFILATLGEEVGFLGTALVVAVFAFLFIQGVRVAFAAPNTFASLVAFGASAVIGIQAAANIAVVTNLVPTKGIALPFVSHGGSMLLVMMALVGIIVNIADHSRSGCEVVA